MPRHGIDIEAVEERIKRLIEQLVSPQTGFQIRQECATELYGISSYKLSEGLEELNEGMLKLKDQWEKSSDQQSKHTRALVWWTGALVGVTLMYVGIEVMRLWHDWHVVASPMTGG